MARKRNGQMAKRQKQHGNHRTMLFEYYMQDQSTNKNETKADYILCAFNIDDLVAYDNEEKIPI